MKSLGPEHETECFQGCSFLAAAPSDQPRLECDSRGSESLGMKISNHLKYTEEKSSWLLLEWKVENTDVKPFGEMMDDRGIIIGT